MGNARLLIVEDDTDIANMLNIFFSGQNYEVDMAFRGTDALEKTRQNLPNLIVLDIMLPDIDGFEVCRILRTNTRTSHVPIIFLTQKDERSDKLQGLELGADDYITKPFDIDELKLRVQRAIERSEIQSLTDPRSGLPAGRLIEEQLRKIIRQDNWTYMDLRIQHLEIFEEAYGFVAGNDVLRFTSMLLTEVVDELGSINDFIGHPGGDCFIVITWVEDAKLMQERIEQRFNEEILSHYNFLDREKGYLTLTDNSGRSVRAPTMNIAIGSVSPTQYEFTDIREITEMAADARRKSN